MLAALHRRGKLGGGGGELGSGLAASERQDPGAHETESGNEAGAMARRDTAPPHGEAEGRGGSERDFCVRLRWKSWGEAVRVFQKDAGQSLSRFFF